MSKECISNKQGISILIMFIMGSTLIMGVGLEAKQDVWIAIMLGVIFAIPMLLIYARLLSLFPGKDLFEILQNVFGTVLGNVVSLVYIWFAFHLGALVIRNFSEFIKIAGMPETPVFFPVMLMGIICIWGVKEGIEVLGRWTQFTLHILLVIIFVVVALSAIRADINNLRPVLYTGFKPVLESAFSVFSFPFAETVVFMMVMEVLKGKKSAYKVYIIGLGIGASIVLIISLRNMLVMGADFVASTFFPSYAAVSLIDIDNFVQRIEGSVSVVFLFAGFAKISVCLLAACKGTAKLFHIEEYRTIVAPVGLLMMNLSIFIYDNIMEMQDWAFKVYKYYAFPFQVILPILILIGAEIKTRHNKKQIPET